MDGQMFFKTLMSNNSSAAPIQFSGDDDTNCFPVSGKDVSIVTSDADHDVGSAKLKIKNIVNYGWEHKFYPGEVVAHDKSGQYVAYAITTATKGSGVVRIINRKTTDRILIKGMVGPVVDLAFSHATDEVVLGAVDSYGNLFVYKVEEQGSGTVTERLVEIMHNASVSGQDKLTHRLVWCPYVPDPESDASDNINGQRMLVLTHGHVAEVWSLDTVLEAHGSGPLTASDVEQGLITIQEIGGDVTDAAFSPTGEAVALAVSDGTVKFFQVYIHEEGPPRCLKSWSPHEGAALSSLLWLDDHCDPTPDTRFWKFVITGCNTNSELKVWCSSTWSCLQTIKFQRPDNDTDTRLRLKAVLDPTAHFLILSDIDGRLLYVLNIIQNDKKAEVVSVAEFASPTSILSLSCESAGVKTVKQTTEGLEVCEDDDEDEKTEKTVVKLYFVQPKSLQECCIIFDNAASSGSLSVSLVSPDVSTPAKLDQAPSLLKTSPATAPLKSPVASSAPASSTSPRSQLPVLPPMAGLAEAASKISLLSPDQFQASAPVSVKQEQVLTFATGNSSPESREVADILDDCVQFETAEDANEEDEEDEEEAEVESGTFRDIKATPPTNLNTSIKFPTPPSPPENKMNAVQATFNTDHMERRLEQMMASKMEEMETKARKDQKAMMDRIDLQFATLSSNINRRIEEAVSTEIKRSLPGLVNKSFTGLEKELSHKLSGLETKVAKELSSGHSRDMIGRSVANSVTELVEASYKQAFANQVTGMERAFGVMLRQINDQFLAGTREYEAALVRRMEVENIEIKEIVNPLASSMQAVNNELRQLRDTVERMKVDQGVMTKQIQDKKSVTGDEVRKIIRKELSDNVSTRGNGVSQTPPRAEAVNNQQSIRKLIQGGKVNEAFQLALSLSDLNLVMFTCENVNTTQVFNQSTCPLSQSVLLSLIQQLSIDLSDKTQVKHAYLHEALVNLDPTHETTKAHMKPVLRQLESSLQKYIQENPNSKMTRNLKLLSMAVNSQLQMNN